MMSPPLRPDVYAGEPRATSRTSTPLFTPNVSRRSAFVRTIVAPAMTIGAADDPENTNTLRSPPRASATGGAGSVGVGIMGAGVATTTLLTPPATAGGGASDGRVTRTRPTHGALPGADGART